MRQRFCFHKSNSGEIARNRLKFLLISDQASIHVCMLNRICEDMAEVLSRYAEVDARSLEIRFVRGERENEQARLPMLEVTFPIRQFTFTRNEECF